MAETQQMPATDMCKQWEKLKKKINRLGKILGKSLRRELEIKKKNILC